MKVVVELSKEEMESYKNLMRLGLGNSAMRKIINGTPLPNGHGRLILINEDTLNRWCIEGDGDDKFTEGYNFAMNVIKSYIAEEPTIIEADKEGEEDGNGKGNN